MNVAGLESHVYTINTKILFSFCVFYIFHFYIYGFAWYNNIFIIQRSLRHCCHLDQQKYLVWVHKNYINAYIQNWVESMNIIRCHSILGWQRAGCKFQQKLQYFAKMQNVATTSSSPLAKTGASIIYIPSLPSTLLSKLFVF